MLSPDSAIRYIVYSYSFASDSLLTIFVDRPKTYRVNNKLYANKLSNLRNLNKHDID